jgi:hypothetical protein
MAVKIVSINVQIVSIKNNIYKKYIFSIYGRIPQEAEAVLTEASQTIASLAPDNTTPLPESK